MLSPAEIQAYQTDGQITPGWRVPDDLLAKLETAVSGYFEINPEVLPDFVPLPHVAPSAAKNMDIARKFFEIVSDPRLLDLVEPLIGPDIIMWTSALFCKPASVGLEVPWHQDAQYWPIHPQATITVWIALDDVDTDNGCMRVIPGSHREGTYNHVVSDNENFALNNMIDDGRIDFSASRDVILERGQVSLHEANLVHGSQPNTSGRRRAGYVVRYMPSTSLYDRDINPGSGSSRVPLEFAERPIWLLRGTDKHGGNDFKRGHSLW
ncbi:MAG: phytanoyl-CoA dioxygenase family protein [Pseudomonadota bacterium]